MVGYCVADQVEPGGVPAQVAQDLYNRCRVCVEVGLDGLSHHDSLP